MIGQLRNRITILDEVSFPDGGGGATLQYNETASYWAAIDTEVVSGRGENLEYQGFSLQKLVIRTGNNLSISSRYRHKDKVFVVTKIETDTPTPGYNTLEAREV